METNETKTETKIFDKLKNFYDVNYKKFLILTASIVLISLFIISYNYIRTGEVIERGVSLAGGVTVTVISDKDVNTDSIAKELSSKLNVDVSARRTAISEGKTGYFIEASNIEPDSLVKELALFFGELKKSDYNIEVIGPSLGKSFFKETIVAIFLAFILMGMVVFLTFAEGIKNKAIVTLISIVAVVFAFLYLRSGSFLWMIISLILFASNIYMYFKWNIPSFFVILAVFSTITSTLAVSILLNIKLSTAGIAAFLMLVGYSVDTDILLTTRVLRRKEGRIVDRIFSAMGTGLTMTLTSFGAVLVAYILTPSETISQIMQILAIGLIFDIINTWLQNASVLRWYIEAKHKHEQA